jgi:NAD-dependent dihydropyrimidine dehydrogenase PreA subunit
MEQLVRLEVMEMVEVVIDREKCDGCGECISVCPNENFELDDEGKAVANPEGCDECCSCVESCPQEAIKIDACE